MPLIVVLHEETINERNSDSSALVLELCAQGLLESLGLELNVGHTRRWGSCPFPLVSAQVIKNRKNPRNLSSWCL